MKAKAIINLTKTEARNFFIESESYCNIDLPEYFDFRKFLKAVEKFDHSGFSLMNAKNDATSHIIYNNKDGRYAWRKLELIHPILYIELLNKLTGNWAEIKKHFKNNSVDKIQPSAIYIRKKNHKKQKKTQILSYLDSIEKESIKQSLEFRYMSKLDIADCYPSVYTHAVSWALHTKAVAKDNRNNSYSKKVKKGQTPLPGNDIDFLLQAMQNGQTNGIPQGSIMMDFVAEIVLTHIDKLLGDKLNDEEIIEYKILRYRDDYRIFTKEKNENEKIIKFLSEILIDFNFKLNTGKTEVGEDIVLMSIKKDKLDNIIYHFGKDQEVDVFRLKRLLLDILNISKIYPNSGFILKMLQHFNERGFYRKSKQWYKKETDLLVTILTNIAVSNPRSFAVVCVSIFNLLTKLDESQKKYFSDVIYRNLLNIHNIGYNEIWLQRSLYKVDGTKEYEEKICKVVSTTVHSSIFGNHFISDKKLTALLNQNNFINRSKLSKMSKTPTADEVDLFANYQN